jgi:hypothetical protein
VSYPGIDLTTEVNSRKTSGRVAALTAQADTVQYKNNEQYNAQNKNSKKRLLSPYQVSKSRVI